MTNVHCKLSRIKIESSPQSSKITDIYQDYPGNDPKAVVENLT